MNEILKELRSDLASRVDEKTKISGQRFFKEDVNIMGIKSAVVIAVSKDHYKRMKDQSKTSVFALCDDLLNSGIMEESFVACNWSYFVHKQYTRDDFETFEKWVNKYVSNWATCDTLCNHSVGTLVEMYPELIENLKKWAFSGNRWVKRASSVSLIIPARKGLFLKDIFQIADILLTDKDDMVQKGYGWMLKAASQAHQDEVFEYVMNKKATMPRTSLRYAIEKMPKELREKAMAR
jgi:3-methyladenine DNA glycosylase AlkD